MKAPWKPNGMWCGTRGAGQLLERARVEDEQRRGAAPRLEHDGEQDAVVLLRRPRALGQNTGSPG